ncbi:MAG: protein translocase subunit SecF [Elusimicrobiota bacterium]
MNLFQNTNIKFIQKKKIAYLLSGILITAGIISMIIKGGPNWGIDFTGGALVQINFTEAVTNDEVRTGLETIGFSNVTLQRFVGSNVVIFRLQQSAQVTGPLMETLKTNMNKNFVVERIEMVGPAVGIWLVKRAALAFSFAFLGIICYVAIRFKGGVWGVAGVLALIHDVLIVVGIFSILNKEITLPVVAALMTLVGYSINDTIVIYDRIRENLRVRYKEAKEKVFNDSINQTLSRTVITSGTTLVTVLALFLFGGKVIHDFSLVLLLGVIVGTYSSIFVASPIVYDWKNRSK